MDRSQRAARAKVVGRIIRAVRKHRGQLQEPVALAGGIKREELSMVENGHHRLSRPPMRQSVAQCMRVPVAVIDALMSEDPLPVGGAADAFSVPVSVIAAAVEAPAQEAVSP